MIERLASLALVTVVAAGCAAPSPSPASGPPPANTSPSREVTVLFVADLHAHLEPHLELFWDDAGERLERAGGLARLAAAVKAIRAERPGAVLLVDGGDTFQGSGLAAKTEGAALVPALNAVGFDAAVPGNWEVAYGKDALAARTAETTHPWFAANLYDEATGERLFAPFVLRDLAGVRVALLGYTDPEVPTRQPPAYSRGLTYHGPDALPALVRELRETHGADVVLLVSHLGLAKAVALTPHVPGLDAHLSADTHERTYTPVLAADGTWVVEPGAFGSFVGRLDLKVQDGRVVDRRWELIELTESRFPEDPEVAALVEAALAPHRAGLDRVVGTAGDVLARYEVVETTLDNLLSDALREATGTDVALSNGFRFGHPLPAGPITEGDLWRFYPIVTALEVGEVTGRQLRAFWERELENVFAKDPARRFGGWLPRPSGLTVTFEAGAPAGSRVRELKVGGEPVEDDRVYTVTACDREGDAPDTLCRIPNARNTRVLEVDAHEAVRAYLARHPEVVRHREGRVVGLDLPVPLRTQR